MRKKLKLVIVGLFVFIVVGCTNTQSDRDTSVERTAFLIDTIVATTLYNNSNFFAEKNYMNTKSSTNSNTVKSTSYSDTGVQSRTVTTSTTKTKSKGFGFGIGN